MENAIKSLEPSRLWHHFCDLSQIPRCSKHEERAREYVLGIAGDCGAKTKTDSTGNIVVSVPAAEGCEEGPVIVLQAHLDMVCEKNKNTDHDFLVDNLRLKKEGDWVTAEGTTLGADNGIGAAACLAILDSKELKHGPLELLFTVDE